MMQQNEHVMSARQKKRYPTESSACCCMAAARGLVQRGVAVRIRGIDVEGRGQHVFVFQQALDFNMIARYRCIV